MDSDNVCQLENLFGASGTLVPKFVDHSCFQALEELRSFMIVNGVALKKRQKLMRNLRVSTDKKSTVREELKWNSMSFIETCFWF